MRVSYDSYLPEICGVLLETCGPVAVHLRQAAPVLSFSDFPIFEMKGEKKCHIDKCHIDSWGVLCTF